MFKCPKCKKPLMDVQINKHYDIRYNTTKKKYEVVEITGEYLCKNCYCFLRDIPHADYVNVFGNVFEANGLIKKIRRDTDV